MSSSCFVSSATTHPAIFPVILLSEADIYSCFRFQTTKGSLFHLKIFNSFQTSFTISQGKINFHFSKSIFNLFQVNLFI
ncbi:MAG: hypothetical protein LBC61_02350 [Candidatus Peribacteria bacterium]|nr:hypothetical protein [Candidatus Peribacteria bacterium]